MKKNKTKEIGGNELINNAYSSIRQLAYDLCMIQRFVSGSMLYYNNRSARLIDLLQELLHTIMDKITEIAKDLYEKK